MTKYYLLILSIFFLTGCDMFDNLTSKEQYKTHSLSEGKALRMNVETGQISLVTDSGIKFLPDDRRVKLIVGKIYYLEDGTDALYQGNMKFTTDKEEIMNVILGKYKK